MQPIPRHAQHDPFSDSPPPPQASANDGKRPTQAQPDPATVIVYDLDGLMVRCHAAARTLVINDNLVRLSPLEYLALVPLLDQFKQGVSTADLLQDVYSISSNEPREARRVVKIVHRMRPKLAPYDLNINAVVDSAGRLWGYMLRRETHHLFTQPFPTRPPLSC